MMPLSNLCVHILNSASDLLLVPTIFYSEAITAMTLRQWATGRNAHGNGHFNTKWRFRGVRSW
jgi:hypothetical protein